MGLLSATHSLLVAFGSARADAGFVELIFSRRRITGFTPPRAVGWRFPAPAT